MATDAEKLIQWMQSSDNDDNTARTHGYGGWGCPTLGLMIERVIPALSGSKMTSGGWKFPDGSAILVVDQTKDGTCPERYEVIPPGSDKIRFEFLAALDDRSRQYLAAVCDRISLFQIIYHYYGELTRSLTKSGVFFSTTEGISFWANAGPAEIHWYHKDGQERWCAEFGYQSGEDFPARLFYFSKLPSDQAIRTACYVYELIDDLMSKRFRQGRVYDEYEEQDGIHWLDIQPGDDIETTDAMDFFIRGGHR